MSIDVDSEHGITIACAALLFFKWQCCFYQSLGQPSSGPRHSLISRLYDLWPDGVLQHVRMRARFQCSSAIKRRSTSRPSQLQFSIFASAPAVGPQSLSLCRGAPTIGCRARRIFRRRRQERGAPDPGDGPWAQGPVVRLRAVWVAPQGGQVAGRIAPSRGCERNSRRRTNLARGSARGSSEGLRAGLLCQGSGLCMMYPIPCPALAQYPTQIGHFSEKI